MMKTLNLSGLTGANLSFYYSVPGIEICCDSFRVFVDTNQLMVVTNAMPAWRGLLSARETEDLVAFVKAVSDFETPQEPLAAQGRTHPHRRHQRQLGPLVGQHRDEGELEGAHHGSARILRHRQQGARIGGDRLEGRQITRRRRVGHHFARSAQVVVGQQGHDGAHVLAARGAHRDGRVQALASALMPGLGRQSVQVGSQQVGIQSILSALGNLAGRAASEMDEGQGEALPDYFYNQAGELAIDPAESYQRTDRLLTLMALTSPIWAAPRPPVVVVREREPVYTAADAEAALHSLAQHELVRLLDRQPGQSAQRWQQLVAEEAEVVRSATPMSQPAGGLAQRVAELEERVARLETALADLL